MLPQTIAAIILFTGPVLSQPIEQLRDDRLLEQVVSATSDGDANELLNLMREVRARGLLMFPDIDICHSQVPDTGILSSKITRGGVNWAYHMRVWSLAIEQNQCGCPYNLLSPDAFALELTDHAMTDLSTADAGVLRSYWIQNRDIVEPAYQTFQLEVCGN
jgi:hypothetical protein